jgi:hypothetical protein
MRVGDRCEIRITWRSKGTWFGGQVVAIAANERSIKVAWGRAGNRSPDPACSGTRAGGGARAEAAPLQGGKGR